MKSSGLTVKIGTSGLYIRFIKLIGTSGKSSIMVFSVKMNEHENMESRCSLLTSSSKFLPCACRMISITTVNHLIGWLRSGGGQEPLCGQASFLSGLKCC